MKVAGLSVTLIALACAHASALAVDPETSTNDTTTTIAPALPDGESVPEMDYLVAEGDTLSEIGQRLLKPGLDWRYLRALNQLGDARRLRAGQRLRIPVTWLREDVTRFTVKSVSGAATINGEALESGVNVGQDDTVETGENGTVVVALPDGTEMRIAPSSQVRIDRLRKYFGGDTIDARMRLERGNIDAVVPKKNAVPLRPGSIAPRIRSTSPSSGATTPLHRIRIDTPRATAAVRGTSFRVGDDSGVTSSAVLEGLVAFGAATPMVSAGNAARVPTVIELPAGFGSVADDSGKVAEPEAMLPAPALRGVTAPIAELSRKLEFPVLPGAASYRVRTATDPEFTTEVRERIVHSPIVIVDSQADGTYHVAARGISPTGVEGFDATAEVRFDARPVAPILNQPNDKFTQFGTRTQIEWFEPKGISQYRLQIARDEAFTDLLVDELVSSTAYTYAAPDAEPAPRQLFWRVASVDDSGKGPFPSSRQFTQRDAGGPSASASVGAGGGATVEWAAIPDASYVVALTPLTTGATPALEIESDQPTANLPKLAPGKYEIRIINVFDGTLRSPPSDPQTFTIPLLWRDGSGNPIIIDNQTNPASLQPD